MALHREHGNITFDCDNCGDTLATGELDFSEARAVLGAERWVTRKDDDTGEWCHYCPACK